MITFKLHHIHLVVTLMISNFNYLDTCVYLLWISFSIYICQITKVFESFVRNPELYSLYFSRAFLETYANKERSYTIWDWIVPRNLVIGFLLTTCISRLFLTEVRENSIAIKIFSIRHEIICKDFWRSEPTFLELPVKSFNFITKKFLLFN